MKSILRNTIVDYLAVLLCSLISIPASARGGSSILTLHPQKSLFLPTSIRIAEVFKTKSLQKFIPTVSDSTRLYVQAFEQLAAAFAKKDVERVKALTASSFRFQQYGPPMAREAVLPELVRQFPAQPWQLDSISKGRSGQLYNAWCHVKNGPPFQLVFNHSGLLTEFVQMEETPTAAPNSNTIVLPFRLNNEYIILHASIDGKSGDVLFDFGYRDLLMLNSTFFPADSSLGRGSGKAGSGQQMNIGYTKIRSLDCFGLHYNVSESLRTSNLTFMAPGTGELIGILGLKSILDYETTIDYERRLITLRRLDGYGNAIDAAILTSKPIASIPLFLDANGRPSSNIRIGSQTLPAVFDTGWPEGAHFSQGYQLRAYLEPYLQGYFAGVKQPDYKTYRLGSFYFKDVSRPFSVNYVTSDDAKALPQKPSSAILGYYFLKKFVTVWNFKKKTLLLYMNE